MLCFHDFSASLWEIFFGNLLFLFCGVFYLIWWIVSFRPGATGGSAGAFCLAAAFITGIAGVALLCAGISALSRDSKGMPVKFIVLGAAVLFIVLLFVTALLFHRQVTSELMIIHIWAAIQLSAIAVLYGTARFGAGSAGVMTVLVGVATVIGLVCYVLYYHLEGLTGYRVGMVPLATDSIVMAVFLCMLAVS